MGDTNGEEYGAESRAQWQAISCIRTPPPSDRAKERRLSGEVITLLTAGVGGQQSLLEEYLPLARW